jgi:hypothetical protein
MKKHMLILILLYCSAMQCSYAQVTFQKTIGTNLGYDYGNSVKQTYDGGFIISGSALTNLPSAIRCAYLIKTDFYGNLVWSKVFGCTIFYVTYGIDAVQTHDGGYIMTAWGSSAGHLILAKTNNAGDSLWCKYYKGMGPTRGYCVRQTPDHGYIVGGLTGDADTTFYSDFLMKMDSTGNILWSKSYGGAQSDQVNSLELTSDKGFILAGATNSFNAGSSDIYIVKTDSVGDTIWSRRYGGALVDYATSIIQCNDKGYVITGQTNSFGVGLFDVYLIKIDEWGNLLWSKTYGGPGYDYGNCVKQTNDKGYIITGESYGLDGELLIKTDSMGNVSWSKVLVNTKGLAVETVSDGGFLIAGSSQKPSSDMEVLLLKTDSLGNSDCGEINVTLQTTIPATQMFLTQTVVTSISSQVYHYPTLYSDWGKDTTLCTSIGIKVMQVTALVNIFPNPATNNLTIETTQKATIEIINLQGQIIKTLQTTEDKTQVDVSALAGGVYIIKLNTVEGSVVRKFVKQ